MLPLTRCALRGVSLACVAGVLLACGSSGGGGDDSGVAGPVERVIVVGAGMSGLAAAHALEASGVEVLVLEARDRLGGRTHTVSLDGVSVDAGAGWIHGIEGNPLRTLADGLGIGYRFHDLDAHLLTVDEQAGELADTVIDAADQAADEFDDELGALLAEEGRNASFATVVDAWLDELSLPDATERLVAYYLNQARMDTDVSGPADLVAARWLEADEGFAGGDHVPEGGYTRFVEALADGLDVRLGETVTDIRYDDQGVQVVTGSQTWEASHVVVTVPLGVLKAGSIRFEPALPADKLAAIDRLQMGNLEKVLLKFPTAFWEQDGIDGIEWVGVDDQGRADGEFPSILDFSAYAGAPVLAGFYGGANARALQGNASDQALIDGMVSVIERSLGREIPTPVASHVTHWTTDPLAGGSYSFIPVGASPDDLDTLADPVAGRVLFAGEATIADYYQSAHGALLSGLREARRLGARTTGLPGL
jgi:polyamine oxidase